MLDIMYEGNSGQDPVNPLKAKTDTGQPCNYPYVLINSECLRVYHNTSVVDKVSTGLFQAS